MAVDRLSFLRFHSIAAFSTQFPPQGSEVKTNDRLIKYKCSFFTFFFCFLFWVETGPTSIKVNHGQNGEKRFVSGRETRQLGSWVAGLTDEC